MTLLWFTAVLVQYARGGHVCFQKEADRIDTRNNRATRGIFSIWSQSGEWQDRLRIATLTFNVYALSSFMSSLRLFSSVSSMIGRRSARYWFHTVLQTTSLNGNLREVFVSQIMFKCCMCSTSSCHGLSLRYSNAFNSVRSLVDKRINHRNIAAFKKQYIRLNSTLLRIINDKVSDASMWTFCPKRTIILL